MFFLHSSQTGDCSFFYANVSPCTRGCLKVEHPNLVNVLGLSRTSPHKYVTGDVILVCS